MPDGSWRGSWRKLDTLSSSLNPPSAATHGPSASHTQACTQAPRPISITYTSMHAGTRAGTRTLAANTHTHTCTHTHTEPARRRGGGGAHYGLEPLLALCACRRRGTRGQAEWGAASGGSERGYGVPRSSEMPRDTPPGGAPPLPTPRSDSSALLLLPATSAAPGTSATPTGPCCMPKRLPWPPPAPSPSEPHCLEHHTAAC
jgi:hypothetical protein